MKKVCSFFGYKTKINQNEITLILKEILENLIINCDVDTFLFGSKSEFAPHYYQIVTELKKMYPHIKKIAYTCNREVCILEEEREKREQASPDYIKGNKRLTSFDEELKFRTKFAVGRAVYMERNKAMIENSDYCIFYCKEASQSKQRKHPRRIKGYYPLTSNNEILYNYAKRKNKKIIKININNLNRVN